MAASPVGVDRVAEAVGRAAEVVDDPLRPDVEELEAAELAAAGLALEDRFVEQRRMRLRRVGRLPAQLRLGHGRSVVEHLFDYKGKGATGRVSRRSARATGRRGPCGG